MLQYELQQLIRVFINTSHKVKLVLYIIETAWNDSVALMRGGGCTFKNKTCFISLLSDQAFKNQLVISGSVIYKTIIIIKLLLLFSKHTILHLASF